MCNSCNGGAPEGQTACPLRAASVDTASLDHYAGISEAGMPPGALQRLGTSSEALLRNSGRLHTPGVIMGTRSDHWRGILKTDRRHSRAVKPGYDYTSLKGQDSTRDYKDVVTGTHLYFIRKDQGRDAPLGSSEEREMH